MCVCVYIYIKGNILDQLSLLKIIMGEKAILKQKWQSAMLRNWEPECICPPRSSLLQYSSSLPFSKSRRKHSSWINYLALNCCNAQQDACKSKVLLMEGTSHDPDGKRSSDCNKCWVGMQHLKPKCTAWETWLDQPPSAAPSSPFPHRNGLLPILGRCADWMGSSEGTVGW